MLRRGSVAFVLMGLAACAQIIGADFDAKRVAVTTTTGQGGTQGGGGAGGEPGLANGLPCESPDACGSGFCVDGLCCDAACDEACRTCDQPEREGVCSPLALGTACPGDPGGVCDGARYCATGRHLFSRVGGGLGQDLARACDFAPSGDFWVGGSYTTSLDLSGGTQAPLVNGDAEQRIFLSHFDDALQHVQTFDLGADDPVTSGRYELLDLVTDDAGNVVIAASIDGRIELGSGSPIASPDEPGRRYVVVIKLTASGSVIWSHVYGLTNDTSPSDGALLAARGGRVVVGLRHQELDLTPPGGPVITTQGSLAATIVAHDADTGAIDWSVTSQNDAGVETVVTDLTLLADGRVVAIGSIFGGQASWGGVPISAPTGDVMLVAIDADGSTAWVNRYGGEATQYGEAVTALPDGTVALAGSFQSTIAIGAGIPHSDSPQNGLWFDGFVEWVDGASAGGDPISNVGVGFGPLDIGLQPFFHTLTADDVGSTVFAQLHHNSTYPIDGVPLSPAAEGHTLAKMAPDHQTYLWVRTFDVTGPFSISDGVSEVYPWQLASAPDGRIALCGHLDNQVDYGGGPLTATDGRDAVVAVFAP